VDLYTAFHAEEFGGEKDSWNFEPERCISKQNGRLNSLYKRVIPFGVGKRLCPGYRVSEVSAFLMIVSILQRFKLSLVPGEDPPSAEMQLSFTSRPVPFHFSIS
jgi:cytochrome P450